MAFLTLTKALGSGSCCLGQIGKKCRFKESLTESQSDKGLILVSGDLMKQINRMKKNGPESV